MMLARFAFLVLFVSTLAACGGGGGGGGGEGAVDPPAGPGGPGLQSVVVRSDDGSAPALALSLGEQLDDYVAFDAVAGQARLDALGVPLFRIHAGADSAILPEPGEVGGNPAWDFSALDRLVAIGQSAGSQILMNIRHAPVSLSTCPAFHSGSGTLTDPSYGEFAAYMANLVAYYNLGQFTDASGTHVNPAGTARRVDYWEIWNEPDLPYEYPCLLPDDRASLPPAEFAAMWMAASQQMLAVDPTIQLVGPSVSDPRNRTYLDALTAAGARLDAVSFHGYGGPNSASDAQLIAGGGDALGVAGVAAALRDLSARLAASGRAATPIFLDEFNLSPDGVDDPAARGWSHFSAAAGGAAYIELARLSASRPMAFIPFQFVEAGGKRLTALDPASGTPQLPYWRDLMLARAVRPGDRMLAVDAGSAALPVLAVRSADGSGIRVLLANVSGPATGIGHRGDAAEIQLDLQASGGRTPRSITLTVLDAGTDAASGPAPVQLDPARAPVVRFDGYGLALVEIAY